jgi:hypothetical protein
MESDLSLQQETRPYVNGFSILAGCWVHSNLMRRGLDCFFHQELSLMNSYFNFNFSEFQQLGNKYAKYILYCIFVIITQWFSIFNNFNKYQYFLFFIFWLDLLQIILCHNYLFIYLFIQSFLKVGSCISLLNCYFKMATSIKNNLFHISSGGVF